MTHATVRAQFFAIAALSCALLFNAGCASSPYQYGHDLETATTLRLQPDEPQFTYGTPRGFLDAADWMWPDSLLAKLLLWNVHIDSHEISPQTEDALRVYLHTNSLLNVKVRVNDYAVKDEWRRLFKNRSVGPLWRYTLGILSCAMYTVLPGRWFGGDNYNPYTNTINLYSDVPVVALHEGAHSKDFAGRKYKGIYAAIYMIPFVSLFHEAVATGDVVGYLREERLSQDEKNAYKVLYPAYATYIGGSISDFVPPPYNYAVIGAAVIPAHITGRIKASYVEPAAED